MNTIMQILHLEDELGLRDIVRMTLSILEPQSVLHQFFSSNDALDYVHTSSSAVHFFILDVRVPGAVDGLGFAEILRREGFKGYIAFTSSYPVDDVRLKQINDHVWLPKPVPLTRMKSTLRVVRERMAQP